MFLTSFTAIINKESPQKILSTSHIIHIFTVSFSPSFFLKTSSLQSYPTPPFYPLYATLISFSALKFIMKKRESEKSEMLTLMIQNSTRDPIDGNPHFATFPSDLQHLFLLLFFFIKAEES